MLGWFSPQLRSEASAGCQGQCGGVLPSIMSGRGPADCSSEEVEWNLHGAKGFKT